MSKSPISKLGSLLGIAFCALLVMAFAFDATPSRAIGKATPTPAPTAFPDELDVDEALESMLALLEEQAYADALKLGERILQEDGEAWRAYYYRGFARVQLEDLEAAIADYTAVLDLRPWDSQFWRLRGELQLQDRNPRAARADYKRALFLNPRSAQTYLRLAELHERDVDKRIHDLYRRLVEASQAAARGASNRALDLLSEAIEGFDRGSIPVELGYAYFARANIWTAQERWDEALADLDMALELQPAQQDYFLARGTVYAAQERLELVGADFYQRMTGLERESKEAALTPGQSVTIEMAHGLVARLRFEGVAGERVTIAARDTLGSGVDPLIALLDPAGEPLLGDDDGGGELDALISDFELPADGMYLVLVSHANGGFEGEVRVSLLGTKGPEDL